ncbi:hypothetical protein GCM10009676_14080 [Prauserella halophila]|uniref:BioF2-like acetyltransferase domain-containing protein n=1 Tax=Prauserella halophila TaxID=185641 RepID=A0ABN1W294_9PSEU|nr:hypothetical protein [Prauserella halophila]MCP2236380.1 hypothetical protein [Prauserella halophila]
MNVEIIDPRVDPEPTGWADFVNDRRLHPVWRHPLIRLEAWTARNPPLLAVVREHGRVVGGLQAMVCRSWSTGRFGPAATRRPARLRPRWAEVYLPLHSGYPAAAFHSGVDVRGAIREFERSLVHRVGPGLLGVLYRAMTDDLADAMSGPQRPHRVIDPAAVLHPPATVDEWRAGLGTDVRATVDAIDADPEVRTDVGAGRDDLDASELAALLNAHRARQDARAWAGGQRSRFAGLHLDTRSPVSPAYLDALLRRPNVLTRTYRTPTGRLLGFSTMITDRGTAAFHHWAAVSRVDGGRPGLHRHAYAQAVAQAIDLGSTELTAGRAMLDEKAALGFRDTRQLHTVAAPRPLLGDRRGPQAVHRETPRDTTGHIHRNRAGSVT